MWTTMKNNLLRERNFDFFNSICTGSVNMCPTVLLQQIFVIPQYIKEHYLRV